MSQVRAKRAKRQRGFGLIEVLVALGVFALVATLLFTALWSGQTQVVRLDKRSTDQEQVLTARRILSEWFEAATVVTPGDDEAVFSGDGKRVVFHATPAERDGGGGLFRIELVIEDAGTGSRLLVRRQRISVVRGVAEDGGGPVRTAELLRLARPLGFAYAGAPINGETAWSDEWDQVTMLPARVQLRDAAAPLIMVSIPIAKDPRCLLRRGPQMMAGGECTVR
ncbi:MAG: hypothetical protein RL291_1364 [Pseudomonadota bacterium]|jgi:prepilin-type N-terminal cleavage/methylation domain-containing protein